MFLLPPPICIKPPSNKPALRRSAAAIRGRTPCRRGSCRRSSSWWGPTPGKSSAAGGGWSRSLVSRGLRGARRGSGIATVRTSGTTLTGTAVVARRWVGHVTRPPRPSGSEKSGGYEWIQKKRSHPVATQVACLSWFLPSYTINSAVLAVLVTPWRRESLESACLVLLKPGFGRNGVLPSFPATALSPLRWCPISLSFDALTKAWASPLHPSCLTVCLCGRSHTVSLQPRDRASSDIPLLRRTPSRWWHRCHPRLPQDGGRASLE